MSGRFNEPRLMGDCEIPDGDAVDIMRKAAKGGFVGGTGHVMKNAKVLLDINPVSGCDSVVFETLAGMVERDYVRRIDFEVKDAEVEDLRDERDEWKNATELIYVLAGVASFLYVLGFAIVMALS